MNKKINNKMKPKLFKPGMKVLITGDLGVYTGKLGTIVSDRHPTSPFSEVKGCPLYDVKFNKDIHNPFIIFGVIAIYTNEMVPVANLTALERTVYGLSDDYIKFSQKKTKVPRRKSDK